MFIYGVGFDLFIYIIPAASFEDFWGLSESIKIYKYIKIY